MTWGQRQPRNEPDEACFTDALNYLSSLSRIGMCKLPVDDTTWNDLNMDAIYGRMDYCMSSAGQDVLYAMLRETGARDSELELRRRLIYSMSYSAGSRNSVRAVLRRIGLRRYHFLCDYMFSTHYEKEFGRIYYPMLPAALFVSIAGCFFNPVFLLGIILSCGLCAIGFGFAQTQWRNEVRSMQYLALVINAAEKISCRLPPELNDIAEQLKTLCAEFRPVRPFCMLFKLRQEDRYDLLLNIVRELLQSDMISLIGMADFMEKHTAAMQQLYWLVGELDACIAIAEAGASGGMCVPEIVTENRVTTHGMVHPLIDNAVPNDLDWKCCALITGSNASGKSSFIKAMAVNCILAQSICRCFADDFSMPRRIMTSMALHDEILAGESYFIVELRSMKRIIDALNAQTPVLCFVDEILRGTNTVERVSASASILNYFGSQNCLCMTATHDIELTRMLAGYRQLHFREEFVDGAMAFSYKLMDGPCDTRNAISLLRNIGFPQDIISDSLKRIWEYERTGIWR